ncbi:putative glycosyltransferase EpsD [subsurface metagenome]
MKSLYCTTDMVGAETGGGIVTRNELGALRSMSEVKLLLRQDRIAPARFHQPESPFLYDYFALSLISSSFKYDLAHFYSGTFSQTIRWLKAQGTKVTYTIAAHDRKTSIEEFGRLGLEYPFLHISDDFLWALYSEGIRLADVVITPSEKSAKLLKSEGCQNVVVIPHGVNLPQEVSPIPEQFDVAYLGQCGPDKGLLYLIQGWGMLNYPDSRLILAGRGTEELETFIRQITDRGNFVLLGQVPDVSDVYHACSVYVQPSVTEGFGIEILEAMSYGRPVIASQGAGASELVGDSGFIVPIRDPGAIAEHIDWLKRNAAETRAMGQKAREKARKYTWAKIRAVYAKMWRGLGQ